MKLTGSFVEGRFLERPNRFGVFVRVDGRKVYAHLPDPGRLRELLIPQHRLLLRKEPPSSLRKTGHTLSLVRTARTWVSLNTHLPNRLFLEALRAGRLGEFRGFQLVRAEFSWGSSRFDFLLRRRTTKWIVEVKSVTLVEGGLGLFPDAETVRGTRHLEELEEASRRGYRTALVFICQRRDARAVAPQEETDPLFAATLRRAARHGVKLFAYRCHVSPRSIRLASRIPVLLHRPAATGAVGA
ncbi:MAG: DNA/RNA nuclease SfsA [Acidobacteria bacterium]|nr:DNA/RNA nuclease SfsA [Acidobacteriota bacterium]